MPRPLYADESPDDGYYSDDYDYDPYVEDDYYDPSGEEGFCAICKERTRLVRRDYGVGYVDMWGTHIDDVAYYWVTPCCEGRLMSFNEDDPREDR